jgi:hypothetical protein
VLLPTVAGQRGGSRTERAGELRWSETRERAPNDILVDLDPEGPSDLLRDAGGDGADAAGPKERRNDDQQVDDKDEDCPHRANRTTAAGTCKTARGVRIAQASSPGMSSRFSGMSG